jgi:hypothetical protein
LFQELAGPYVDLLADAIVVLAIGFRGDAVSVMSDSSWGPEARLDRPDRVDALMVYLEPTITDILDRLEGDEFTTIEFIELLQTDSAGRAAYEEALRRWGEGEHYAKMVVHGQIIPGILRRSPRVEWLGFAHGVDDPYAVPARWGLRPRDLEMPADAAEVGET